MNRLRIFRPDESDIRPFRPNTIAFTTYARHTESYVSQDSLERARLIHRNRHCPFCNHARVGLIELQDAIMNRNQLPIPGTATLVGFRCNSCQREWPSSLPVCESPITANS